MEESKSKNGRTISKGIKRGTGRGGRTKSSVLAEASALIQLMKDNKVEIFEGGGYSVKLSPYALFPEVTSDEKNTNSQAEEDGDDLLFYSAPGRPQ
jgi:hypothetical protein